MREGRIQLFPTSQAICLFGDFGTIVTNSCLLALECHEPSGHKAIFIRRPSDWRGVLFRHVIGVVVVVEHTLDKGWMLACCRRLCQHWAMTQRAALRQKDIERLIKAAENTGAIVQVDLKTLVATTFPAVKGGASVAPIPLQQSSGIPVRRGKENWDD